MQVVYIFLLICTVAAAIGIANERSKKKVFQRDGLIKVGNSCKTYENKFGNCTTKINTCTENLFHKKIVTRSEYQLIKKSKCGNANQRAVCCLTRKPRNINRRFLLNSKICGKNNPVSRIFSGYEADIYDHPWMALLIYGAYGEKSKLFLCGGTLINKRYVLTAAHCVRNTGDHKFMNAVRLGELDLATVQECTNNESNCNDQPIDVGVKEVIVHNQFIPKTIKNDIALLRLNITVTFTYYIRPICLPIEQNLRYKEFNNIPLTIVGWGRTELGIKSNKKLFTEVLGVHSRRCKEIYRERTKPIVEINSAKQLCAGGDAQDSCDGDSGGPLLYHDLDTWTIVGIVSFGVLQCGSKGFPTVYTRVGAYIEWIINNIE